MLNINKNYEITRIKPSTLGEFNRRYSKVWRGRKTPSKTETVLPS